MSTAARKARKRAGEKFTKPQKTATVAYQSRRAPRGLGMVSGAEIMAGLVIGDYLWRRGVR